jgi:putative FmdB family regulatory protein
LIYEFYCKDCDAIDEVERPVHEAKLPYDCPECDAPMKKNYTVPNTVTKGEQIPYMHPAFGRVMTDRQAKMEARRNGWDEVGTEDIVKHTAAPKRQEYEV